MPAEDTGSMQDLHRKQEPVVLVILDGWGISANQVGNAILHAAPPAFTRLWNQYPHRVLQAFSPLEATAGKTGASDIGHSSIGSGRLVHSDISDISLAIASGEFFDAPPLHDAAQYALTERVPLHLVGLVSAGGIHSHIDHLYGLLELARRANIPEVYIHAITDGIDSVDGTAWSTLASLESMMRSAGIGKLASVSGRDYAMNRSENWKQTNAAYQAMVGKSGPTALSVDDLFTAAQARGESDRSIIPTTLVTSSGTPIGAIRSKDAVIVFNTRPDRTVQLVRRLADPALKTGGGLFKKATYVGPHVFTLADYHLDTLAGVTPLFRHSQVRDCLAQILSDHGVNQARIASEDRSAHVTYYFNGGRQEPFPKENRHFTKTPVRVEDVGASVTSLAATATSMIRGKKEQFIVINLDAVDRVAHTGDFMATTHAVRAVDTALDSIATATLAVGGVILVTADHGNAESMLASKGGNRHTANGVPLIIAADGLQQRTQDQGTKLPPPNGVPDQRASLADVAPTVLALFGIAKPTTMTGSSLLPQE